MNKPDTVRSAALCLAAMLAGCAVSERDAPRDAPAALQVPAGQMLSLKALGDGVQIYACRAAANDASHFSWALMAPMAKLYSVHGVEIGKHFAGPTWQADDDSRVVAEVKAKVDSPDGSIPWLLLAAKSNAGDGLFGKVASVQRLHTVGGVAPAEGCDSTHAGAEVRVPYKADYYFYTAAK
ncbi:MAG: DUF3455 domain-containing protein [Nevskia sp.]|nr:DUF3455 domain-containing protein [Nevskia sp.]